MRRKFSVAIAVAMAVLVFFPGGTRAGSDTAKKPLTLVIDLADFYPYYYRVAGKLAGPMPEITRAVLSEMGYAVTFEEVPWSRAVDQVKRRQVDGIVGIFYRKERDEFLHYPETYPMASQLSLITPKDSGFSYHGDNAALDRRDVGAVLGWSYGLFAAPYTINRIDVADEKVLVRNVAMGRIGIGIGNPASLMRYAEALNAADRVRVLTPPVEETPLYTAFAKKDGHDELTAEFAAALDAFKKTPAFGVILQQHGVILP